MNKWTRIALLAAWTIVSVSVMHILDPHMVLQAAAGVAFFGYIVTSKPDAVLTRYEARHAMLQTPAHDFSLSLRSFSNDQIAIRDMTNLGSAKFEDRIFRHMSRVAPAYRVLDYETKTPGTLGARPLRDVHASTDWQEIIRRHAESAHCKLVVICPFDSGADQFGVLDEIRIIETSAALQEKAILILPPNTDAMLAKLQARIEGLEPRGALMQAIVAFDAKAHFAAYCRPEHEPAYAHVSRAFSWRPRDEHLEQWDREVANALESWAHERGMRGLRLGRARSTFLLNLLAVFSAMSAFALLESERMFFEGSELFEIMVALAATVTVQVALSRELAWHVRAALEYSAVKTPLIKHAAQTVLLAMFLG